MKALLAAALHGSILGPGLVLMATGAALAALRKVPEKIGAALSHAFLLSVDLRQQNVIFAMEIWLAAQATPYRTLAATFHWPGQVCNEARPPTVVLSPGRGRHLLIFRRRLLLVVRSTEEVKLEGKAEYFTVRTWGRDPTILRELLSVVAGAYHAFRHAGCQIFIPRFDEWQPTNHGVARSLESVVLRAGQLEEIQADLDRFRSRATWYAERGVPYRRGYLLYGPPGTGKSSLVRALTAASGMQLCVLNLGQALLSDEQLMRLLSQVPPGAAVLVEDMDCAMAAQRRDDEDKKGSLTLSGLLNALDGVLAAEGRILFMTTNLPEALDEALIRPGRVDLHLHLGLADQDQAQRMYLRFHPGQEMLARRFAAAIPDEALSPAELQGLLLDHEGPEEAVRAAERLASREEAIA
jgi:chaperone BCS1